MSHTAPAVPSEPTPGHRQRTFFQPGPAERPDDVREVLSAMDGSLAGAVSVLTGLSRADLDELGGIVES